MTDRFQRVALDDGTLFVAIQGSGPPVLLVHGLSAHHELWRQVTVHLETKFTLLAPDLLSRGASEAKPDVGYHLTSEIARLVELLERLHVTPRILVGHSHGAALAVGLATKSPWVEAIVLTNPVTPWTRRPPLLALLNWTPLRWIAAELVAPARRPLVRYILHRAYGPDYKLDKATVGVYADPFVERARARALLRALAEWRPAELNSCLPSRRLWGRVLAGEWDRRIGTRHPAALASHLELPFEIVEGTGHVIPEERPEAVAEAVTEAHRRIDAEHQETTE